MLFLQFSPKSLYKFIHMSPCFCWFSTVLTSVMSSSHLHVFFISSSHLPQYKCDGVNTSSTSSSYMYVSGRLLIVASTSLVTVVSSFYFHDNFDQASLSGLDEALNESSPPWCLGKIISPFYSLCCIELFQSLPLNVFPLSETISFGISCLAINLLWLLKAADVDWSRQISKCNILDAVQVVVRM